ncbi:Rhodanese-like domain-containing protein [Chytridium lagenaria]|nr:Rhodanese-like domain-containing protein [Chytridium lagenaria]
MSTTKMLEVKELGEIVEYEEIKERVEKNDASGKAYRLIDVREVHEVLDGRIPTAMCLPVDLLEESLKLEDSAFFSKYGFAKPKSDEHIIFYCRSGRRSARAVDVARKAGFVNVRNYSGSWLEWAAKQQEGKSA